MADYTITPANVHIYEGARFSAGKFGSTMVAGKVVVFNAVESEWVLADANAEYGDQAKLGVVLVGAAEDGYGVVVTEGPMDLGTTLTAGVAVIASTTAGGAAPASDWAGYSGAHQYHIGYATSAATLVVKPFKTGASVA